MLKVTQGDAIEVYDMKSIFIGKGKYLRTTLNVKDKLTQYECTEGAIVVVGEHIVRINGGNQLVVSEPKTW